MRVRLTQAIIRNAKAGSSRLFLWDTEVPGLGYVVHPSGNRGWVYQGTATGDRRVTVQAATLAEARKAGIGIANGFLPAITTKREGVSADTLTMGVLLGRWLTSLTQRPSPPVSLPRIRACLTNHVLPRLKKVPFAALTRDDLLAVRDRLAASGRRGMANQTTAYIRAALRWAEDSRLIAERPRWRVSRLRLGSRAHALTDDQWLVLLRLLRDPSPATGLNPIPRLALLALALTGCRKGEIAGLRWADVGDGFLIIPRHKTAAVSGPKRIPCPPLLIEVLREARLAVLAAAERQPTVLLREALEVSPYVFPTTSRNGMGKAMGAGLERTWADIRGRAGLPSSMTIHGLRAAFITQAQRLGLPLATVAAMVGHESPMTTLRHYTAPTSGEVAEAAQRMTSWITRTQPS
jgi:integrase